MTQKENSKNFSKHVVTLMTGTLFAQAIPIAITPILTRLYGPDDFGTFALYLSLVAVLATFATGRYELAIAIPKMDHQAINLLALSLSISVVISFFTLFIVWFFNEQIVTLLANQSISLWLYFLPISVFLTGAYQSFYYWHGRSRSYKLLAQSQVVQSSTTAGSNLVLGFNNIGDIGLIISSIFGQFISALNLGIKTLMKDRVEFKYIKLGKMLVLSKKYIKFPTSNLPHALVNVLKENIVILFITIKYSQIILGHYFLVLRIMKIPVGVVGNAFAQVFYREAIDTFNQKKSIYKLVKKFIIKLFLFSIIPFILIIFFAEAIFCFVFGSEWLIAGKYAQGLSLYIMLHFIASPLSTVPLVINKQDIAFIWGIFESILFISCFIFGYLSFKDLYKTFILLSGVMAIYFPIYFYWILSISKSIKK